MRHDTLGILHLDGAARDFATTNSAGRILATAKVSAGIDRAHNLLDLVTEPSSEPTSSLVGSLVGPGFRAALAATIPDEQAASSPLFMLLDELPVATLISGYALMYSGALAAGSQSSALMKADICSGWRSDGLMLTSIRQTGHMPVPVGPIAPALERTDDPEGWHAIEPLARGTMRRRRLVELSQEAGSNNDLAVFAMFRDSHVGDDGIETVLHEYSLSARIDPGAGTLEQCVAVPHVLPWNECPDAAASAHQLDGQRVEALRELVRGELRGVGTCTHLNDLLRSLADLAVLQRMLGRRSHRPE